MSGFTWGETVRIRGGAPASYRPGALAAVCGMRQIENAEQAQQFSRSVETTVYLIEFGDGESVEIPEDLLERLDSTP